MKRALQSTGRILVPNDLVMNLRSISRNFRKSRQEDAHEYMVNLLESMHKCCLPSGVPSESPSAYDISLVHKIFGGRLRSQVKCMQCSYCSNTFDPFLDLSLEIMKADSLHKALNHFTAVEQLDGGEKQYQCHRCRQKVKALKQLTVHKAPYVLSIHLKRFGSRAPGQKIDKKVEFGPTLDLKPFVSNSNDGDLKYTLYGVLVHAGWSTHSGHYFCFVRTSSGMWHSLDDNRVVQVSERTVLQQKAYMLFYVRDRKIPATQQQIEREEILSSVPEKGDMRSSVKQKEAGDSALTTDRLQTLDSFGKPQVKESCMVNISKSSVTHTQSTLSSVAINKVNLEKDSEGERPSVEQPLQKTEVTVPTSEARDPEKPFIKSCKRNECVQKALGDNNNLVKVLKPKKKVRKLRVASVHLSSRFMFRASSSLYKKKKKQKTSKCQSLEVKSLFGKEHKKFSISGGVKPSTSEHLDGATGEPNTSHKKESFCENRSMNILTRGMEEFTVARWDDIETSPSEIVRPKKGQNINIGYVPNEWDEEYDRGKRKRVKNGKESFTGSNPFQEMANKKAKLRNLQLGRSGSKERL